MISGRSDASVSTNTCPILVHVKGNISQHLTPGQARAVNPSADERTVSPLTPSDLLLNS